MMCIIAIPILFRIPRISVMPTPTLVRRITMPEDGDMVTVFQTMPWPSEVVGIAGLASEVHGFRLHLAGLNTLRLLPLQAGELCVVHTL